MKDKKFFCYEIFKNLSISSDPDGHVKYSPCCYYKGFINDSAEIDIDYAWDSAERQQLKQLIADDMSIPGCVNCYRDEERGVTSKRLAAKEQYEEFQKDTNIDISGPQALDYRAGNLCNLKCMICGPNNSTAWIPDYQKMYPTKSVQIFKHNKNINKIISDVKSLENIKMVHFHGGGEPLMSTDHIRLLTDIKSVKGLADVRVTYNTNGTVRVDDQVLELWSQCKLVEIYFSIDDVGKRFEYQRTGAKWSEVTDNIEWYKHHMPHNHMFNINAVWGYLNFFYLNELVDWHRSFLSTNRYGDVTNLLFQQALGKFSLTTISDNIKSNLEHKFKNYPTLMLLLGSLPINNDFKHTDFWNHVDLIDKVRGTCFKNICPEWSNLI